MIKLPNISQIDASSREVAVPLLINMIEQSLIAVDPDNKLLPSDIIFALEHVKTAFMVTSVQFHERQRADELKKENESLFGN